MFQNILVPVDGSEASNHALDKASMLAKAFGARLTLLTVVEKNPGGIRSVVYQAEDSPVHQGAKDSANHWLLQGLQRISATGVSATSIVGEHASVYQCVLETAKSRGVDLIVMGTHGAGALERLLVGSQTQRVLAHTDLPVLVVH